MPCTEAGLNAAIAAGGSQTFNCSVPTTITITGTKTIFTTLVLEGGGLLTISGNNLYQVFKVNGGITLTLKNLTVTGGYSEVDHGGAIKSNGAVVLDGVTIDNNHSDYSGGAFYGGQITINNSTISNNTAGTGGGVYAWGSHVNVTNSTFTNNTHTALSQGSSNPSFPVQLNITNSTFTNNEGTAVSAGGNTFLNVLGSTFNGNSGGAISSWTNRVVNIANSTFSGNNATNGGAIYHSYESGQYNITNSTFYGNSATTSGGAIYLHSGTMTLQDSLLSANTGGDCAVEATGTLTGTGNLSDGSCTGTSAAPTGVDATLANNGGPTLTHKLLAGSNALNAGGTCKYRSGGTNPLFTDNTPLTVDQRGAARNTPCDIGAFEEVAPILVKDNTTVIPNGGSADYPLRRTTDAAASKTFRIENWGTGLLTLTPPGSYPAGCSLVGNFPTTISAYNWAEFQLSCTSAVAGEFSGAVSFGTSVAELNPFSFTVYHFAQNPGIVGVGTARSCTGAAFDLGISDVAAGGTLTFSCGASPTTIVTTSQKNVDAAITLDGGGVITLSGNNHHRLFYIGDNGMLTLQNITLSNCYVASTATNPHGGAIYSDFGDLDIQNCTFSNNEANDGGAIYYNSNSVLSITNSSFSGNIARGSGGGLYTRSSSRLDISASSFAGNTAQTSGGGIYTEGTESRVETSTFTNNQAVWYGGAYCHSCLSYAGGTKILNISDSTFTNNVTGNAGGAIYNGEMAYIAVLGSTFVNNRAGTGGAISNLNYQNVLNVANSTFSGNIGVNAGGAIYNSRDVYVSNVTFVGNTAPAGSGGGLYAWDWKTRVKNSLFMNNTGGDCAIGGGYTGFSGENNLSDTTCTGSLGVPTYTDATLAANGGPTSTHALRHRTNAYNAVPDTKCTFISGDYGNLLFTNGEAMTTDQRGLPRLGRCDIGAFEYYGPVITAEPQGQIIVSGQTTILSVTATGPGTLAYEWYQGAASDTSTPVGTNSSSYTTPTITQETAYWVRVTNKHDNADSLDAVLTVNVPPQITEQPANQNVTPGGKVTLKITATGTPTLAYQWYMGDSGDTSHPIPGATAATYTTPALFSEHRYWVRVSNLESADSDTAVISLNSPAGAMSGRNYFTTQPVTLTWSAIPGAVGYELEVARDAAFANKVPTSLDLGANDFTASVTVPDNGPYYWRVRAKLSPTSVSGWSVADSFIVDAP